MSQNMNIEEIQKLIEGKLRGKKKKEVEKLIESDTELHELYLLIKSFSEASLSSDSKLSSAAKKLSGKIYKDFQNALKQKTKKLGVQVFDSSLLPVPDGIRPAAVDTKTVKYILERNSLELTIYPITIDSAEIIGVIDIDSNESDPVQVVIKTTKEKYTTELDEFSLFRFERIPVGRCKLSLYENKKLIGAIEIVI